MDEEKEAKRREEKTVIRPFDLNHKHSVIDEKRERERVHYNKLRRG